MIVWGGFTVSWLSTALSNLSALSKLVPEERLASANALNEVADSAAGVGGSALSSALIASQGPRFVFREAAVGPLAIFLRTLATWRGTLTPQTTPESESAG
ncbi:hypothetical protein [Streptomyces sp. NPDC048606]|uniref:hypothetical protein n=1 Tax=Streptomyces sp. NPDC048606 TaxID=3154726 RepID=UPI00343AB71F